MDKNSLQERLRDFKTACRRVGLRMTHQRLEIFSELASATDHPSAETLHLRMQKRLPTISLDTIYRTLATFRLHGLAQKIETVDSQARFEAVHERHHHLICKQCNEIIDFHWPLIDEVALPDEITFWGKVESKNIVAYGICRKCLQSP